jgi:uncharacterized protein
VPEETWKKVKRIDLASGELGDKRRTQQGGLIARANLTRTGIFTYRNPDGSTRRELRHPDDVFDPESLKTLAHATFTDDHPDKVHPDNWRHVARGHVVDPKKDGNFVAGEIHIQDSDAIRKAEKGDLQETSCGYECRLDTTPGKYNGEDYDARQKDIRYNHVAAGPAGWGRAGPQVRLHLDAAMAVSGGAYVSAMPTVEELQAKLDAEKARADAAEKERDAQAGKVRDLSKSVDTLTGQVDVMKTKVDAVDKGHRDAADQRKLDSYVDDMIALVMEAHDRLDSDDAKWNRKHEDGRNKSTKEIRLEILKGLEPTLNLDGKSDEYVAGACEAAIRRDNEARAGFEDLQLSSMYGGMEGSARSSRPGRRSDRGNPFAKKPGSRQGPDDDDDDDQETQDAAKRMVDGMKKRWKDGQRVPGRDAKEMPMHSAFSGGNNGRENAGGFGGGMGG